MIGVSRASRIHLKYIIHSILDSRDATDQGIQGVDNPYDLETIDPYDTSDGIRVPARTTDARQGQGVGMYDTSDGIRVQTGQDDRRQTGTGSRYV